MMKLSVVATALLMLIRLPSAAADQVLRLDVFPHARETGGAVRWRAGNGAPGAEATSTGVRFDCPAGDGRAARVFWDWEGDLNLAAYGGLELDLSCAQPEAVLSLGVYARSGEGWYVWLLPLKDVGFQKLVLPLAEAGTEGRPAGWERVSGLRLSVTRAGDRPATVTAHALRARACDVVVVKGTVSLTEAAEKKAAHNAATRVSRWLRAAAISHETVTDEAVSAGRLRRAKIALLPYNAVPPERELDALAAFVARGGRLIVCYSQEPRLADVLRLKLGAYRAVRAPERWTGFAFTAGAPAYVPDAVAQESGNIRPAYPTDETARVIAYWQRTDGAMTDEPAWVLSDNGAWMSHILMDGDDGNKQRLLLALLGHFDPAIWKEPADEALRRAGRVGPYLNMRDAVSGLSKAARASPHEKDVMRLLGRAEQQFDRMCTLSAQRAYAETVETGRALTEVLTAAYARVQRARQPEFRGVWNHDGVGLYPGDWPRTCGLLARQGLTAVFPNLAWPGATLYAGDTYPASALVKTYGDQARACVAAAHRAGLEVHAWKVCWNLERAAAEWIAPLRKAGRLQQTDAGETLNWLCPSHPENVKMELASLAELAGRYDLDGIHLDYLRYPSVRACYCAGCKKRFETTLGRRVWGWPRSAATGKYQAAYAAWRRDELTAFLRAARQTVRAENARVKMSAAVYPGYPECATSLGQDWGAWLKDGLVDFVCPMNYTEAPAAFQEMVRRQLALPGAAGRLYPGLGVTAKESRLTPDETIGQILALRALGASGFLLFDLNRTLAQDTLPLLGAGITAP